MDYRDETDRERMMRRRRARARRQRQIRRRRRIFFGIVSCLLLLTMIGVVSIVRHRRAENTDAGSIPLMNETADLTQTETGAEDSAQTQISETGEDSGWEGVSEEDPALIEQLKAERNLSPAVASFALGYTFRETGQTYYFPSVQKTEEEEVSEETQGEDSEEDTASNASLSLDANGDGIVTFEEEGIASRNLILVDADTNEIIAARDPYEVISPASMTKALTVLVAVEQMTDPAAQLEDTFTLTSEIEDYAYVSGSSAVCWMPGDVATVRDLLYGTVLPSGADAALALAEYTSGSQEAFVELMNERLESLGLSDTAHFTNCIGLYDENHYCTVYDMAVIMKACMENDLVREVMAEHTYTTSPTSEHPEGIEISNWFLRRIEDKDSHGLVLCAKTGFVKESGFCAVSYQEGNDGGHYICVTGDAWGNWRCIYDHVMIYKQFH